MFCNFGWRNINFGTDFLPNVHQNFIHSVMSTKFSLWAHLLAQQLHTLGLLSKANSLFTSLNIIKPNSFHVFPKRIPNLRQFIVARNCTSPSWPSLPRCSSSNLERSLSKLICLQSAQCLRWWTMARRCLQRTCCSWLLNQWHQRCWRWQIPSWYVLFWHPYSHILFTMLCRENLLHSREASIFLWCKLRQSFTW